MSLLRKQQNIYIFLRKSFAVFFEGFFLLFLNKVYDFLSEQYLNNMVILK